MATSGGNAVTLVEKVMARIGRRPKGRKATAATAPPGLPPAGGPPAFGAASAAGPVRKDNQDRVEAGVVAGHACVALADGVGGLPHGGEAAEAAVAHAYARLGRELPEALPASAEGVRTLLLSVVWSAATRLASVASATGRNAPGAGFRTTLVLAVALGDAYVACWIGDGGVFVLRETGDLLPLLVPHKDAATPNLLDASLGPAADGRPSWAIAPRQKGDVLVAATDGIADAFDATMAALVRTELGRARGNPAEAAAAVVGALAAARDEDGGFLHSDNLTLALLLTP